MATNLTEMLSAISDKIQKQRSELVDMNNLRSVLGELATWTDTYGAGDSIYSADGTVGAGRVATITDELTFDGKVIVDSNPTPIYETDFENGTLGDFTTSGDTVWAVEIGTGNGGGNSARSGIIGHSEESVLTLTKTTTTPFTLMSFDYDLGTEDTFDGMRIFVDAVEVSTVLVSTVGYSSIEVTVAGIGAHTIDIKYTKDGGTATLPDRLLIDNFKFTPVETNLVVNSATRLNNLLSVKGAVSLESDLNVAGNTVTQQINATTVNSTYNFVEAGTFPLGQFTAFSQVALTTGFALPNNSLRTMFSVGGRALNDALTEYNNTVAFGVSSNNTNTSDPTRPVPIMQMTDGDAGVRIMLAGHTKASGASGMQSRLQIGFSGSSPDQSNDNTLHVFGTAFVDDRMSIGTLNATNPVKNNHALNLLDHGAKIAFGDNQEESPAVGGQNVFVGEKGIGTDTDALQLQGKAGTYITYGVNGENTAMFLKNNGNVAIGVADPLERVHSDAKVRADTGFNFNGNDGLTETLNFGGGGTGDVASLTVEGGIITGKTLVP